MDLCVAESDTKYAQSKDYFKLHNTLINYYNVESNILLKHCTLPRIALTLFLSSGFATITITNTNIMSDVLIIIQTT